MGKEKELENLVEGRQRISKIKDRRHKLLYGSPSQFILLVGKLHRYEMKEPSEDDAVGAEVVTDPQDNTGKHIAIPMGTNTK